MLINVQIFTNVHEYSTFQMFRWWQTLAVTPRYYGLPAVVGPGQSTWTRSQSQIYHRRQIRTNYLVETKPILLLTFLNIKYFITSHFSPHLHKNNRFYFRREALRGRGDSAELSAWAKASTGVAHLHQPAPVPWSTLVATCLPHSLSQVGWTGRRSRWRDTHWTAKLPSFKV